MYVMSMISSHIETIYKETRMTKRRRQNGRKTESLPSYTAGTTATVAARRENR